MTTRLGIPYKDSWLPWILFVTVTAIYLSFPTRNYYWDGIAFAQMIEDANGFNTSLIHPNHLLYNFVGAASYRLVQALGFNLRAVAVLQILNAFLGAGCIALFFQILQRALRSWYLSLTLTLLFAFSATWWKFTTDADSYIASILFLLVSFYLVMPGKKARPVLVALAFFASMCFHQLAVIFYPVLAAGLFLQSPAQTQTRRLLAPLYFSLLATFITLATYCLCFYLITSTCNLHDFTHWITSFSPDVAFSSDFGNNLFYTLRGHWRLFLGGRLNAIKGITNPFIIVLLAILTLDLVALLYKVARNLKRPDFKSWSTRNLDPERKNLLLLCALWIIAYVIFLFVWLPHNTFYRLFYLPALVLLVGLLLSSREHNTSQTRKYRLALFVVVVALANFLFLIFPYTHVQKYPPLAFALGMNQALTSGTTVYYGSPNSDNRLIRYFNPGLVWKPISEDWRHELENAVRADVRGGGIWLETSAIDQLASSSVSKAWLIKHTRAGSERTLATPAHNIKFVQIIQAND